MNLHVISTGSHGNCYLLRDDQGRVIALDAGVSMKRIAAALNHDISVLDGALITHEHGDHSKAIEDLLKVGVPVYLSRGTSNVFGGIGVTLPLTSNGQLDVFKFGNWYVQPFSTQHDAADPVGFLLANKEGCRILYATDTFYIRYKFQRINFIIIECNYCTDILMHNIETGNISGARKDRLLHSHFSLENVLKFLKATDLSKCLKIVLMHLSDANSDAQQMVNAVFKQTGIETIAADDGMDIDFDLF